MESERLLDEHQILEQGDSEEQGLVAGPRPAAHGPSCGMGRHGQYVPIYSFITDIKSSNVEPSQVRIR